MSTNPEISQHYPKTIALDETLVQTGPQFLRLRPGGSPQIRQVPLRLMGAGDKAKILEFAHGLPEEALLFLRSDISDPAAVDDWVRDIERGTTITLLAEPDSALAGYTSIHVNPLRWTHRVGEIGINTAPNWQSRGLGEGLVTEIVALAGTLELRKITAQMVADHKNARALFERLGFHVEALLPDWVEDRNGNCRDLLLMAYDLRTPGHHGHELQH
jgi:RimJ/RimL family protein N-acetyltransferase